MNTRVFSKPAPGRPAFVPQVTESDTGQGGGVRDLPAHRGRPLAGIIPDFWALGSAGVLTILHVWGSQPSLILTKAALSSTPPAACRATDRHLDPRWHFDPQWHCCPGWWSPVPGPCSVGADSESQGLFPAAGAWLSWNLRSGVTKPSTPR